MTTVRQPWRWLPFGARLQLARVRNQAGQYRVLRRSLAIGLLALSLLIIGGARAQASASRTQWGATVDVLVVTNALASGDSFDGHVELQARPAAHVSHDALTGSIDVDESSVRPLEPGDIVTARDLSSSAHGMSLTNDQRAVSLPIGPGTPSLQTGDHVELYVVFDTFGEPDREPKRIEPALVIDVTEDDITIAVHEREVATLAQASTSGQVIVARR